MKPHNIIEDAEVLVSASSIPIKIKLFPSKELFQAPFWQPSTEFLLKHKFSIEVEKLENNLVNTLQNIKKIFCNKNGEILILRDILFPSRTEYHQLFRYGVVSKPLDNPNTNKPITKDMIEALLKKELTKRVRTWAHGTVEGLAIETKSIIKLLLSND